MPAELEPGGETTLRVTLKDANGQPVPDAELAVVVVDEAILALTNYQMADPISIFYSDRAFGCDEPVRPQQHRAGQPASLAGASRRSTPCCGWRGGAMRRHCRPGDGKRRLPPAKSLPVPQPTAISVRSDFNPLATFAPTVTHRLQRRGARALSKLPDNLTRYRIMVVAVDETGRQFGVGESNLTARLPLMVRPSAPRFLNFGDKFELPVVLQNQTDEPHDRGRGRPRHQP